MSAPPIATTRGSVTHTLAPIERNGFRISGSVTQSGVGADWSINLSTFMFDAAVVDDDDQSWRRAVQKTMPYNEAPSEQAMLAELQQLVDEIYDEIPTPTPPGP